MSKLLSIAIPTYNRANDLEKTLNNFIEQVVYNHLENDVEILISDNCSTDNTPDLVQNIQKQYSNIITYSRNSENIMWNNIRRAAEISNGRYVWFCGDDDEYLYNSLKRLTDILKNNDVDGIYLNQVNTRGYITPVEKDEVVDMERFFKIVKQDPEFISTVVIKKEKINPDITNTTWYHMACLLYLKPNDKFYVTKEPFVYNRPSKRAWVNRANLINYTLDALEVINKSNASLETKNILSNIYISLLKVRIILAKLDKTQTINIHEIAIRLDDILFDEKIKKKYKLLLKSKLYCKIIAHRYKYKKYKIPFNKSIHFEERI